MMKAGNYEKAADVFAKASGYGDSKECEQEAITDDACEAVLILYKELGDYKDSELRLRPCRDASIPCEEIGAMYNNRAVVKRGEKYGYVDETGRPVIPCEYERATAFQNGRAMVKKDGRYYMIDQSNAVVLECEFDSVSVVVDGVYCITINDKYGFADETGKIVIPCEYDYPNYPGEGIIKLKR